MNSVFEGITIIVNRKDDRTWRLYSTNRKNVEKKCGSLGIAIFSWYAQCFDGYKVYLNSNSIENIIKRENTDVETFDATFRLMIENGFLIEEQSGKYYYYDSPDLRPDNQKNFGQNGKINT